MPYAEIIVLANSKKEGGRCVAGLETDGGGWIRPVAPGADDALYSCHYALKDNKSEPRLLDVVKINLLKPRPLPHQPENWIIGEKPWTLVERPAGPDIIRILRSHLTHGPALLGDMGDRMDYRVFQRRPAEASLTLVAPVQVRRRAVPRPKPRRPQTRATFSLSNVQYDLPVTDPRWQHELGRPEQTFSGVWLTISLGEPFMGLCYKLVAGVIGGLPEARQADEGRLPCSRDRWGSWWQSWFFEE